MMLFVVWIWNMGVAGLSNLLALAMVLALLAIMAIKVYARWASGLRSHDGYFALAEGLQLVENRRVMKYWQWKHFARVTLQPRRSVLGVEADGKVRATGRQIWQVRLIPRWPQRIFSPTLQLRSQLTRREAAVLRNELRRRIRAACS